MDSLRKHLNKNKKSVIIDIIFSRITLLPLIILAGYIITAKTLFLIILGAIILFYLFVTIPRYRRYYKDLYDYLEKFIELLKFKRIFLANALKGLNQSELPRNLYWIDYQFDSSTFKIEPITHWSNGDKSTNNIETAKNELAELLMVDPSLITELKKKGWGSEVKLEISLQLIMIWFSEIWHNSISSEVKVRSTFSVKNRTGYFNLKTNKWENLSIIEGQPIEVKQYSA